MAYEIYKQKVTREEYFKKWDRDNVEDLTDELKDYIFNKHLIKSAVFNRDNFKCQNDNCKTPLSPLTFHHVKFKKNGGAYKERNGVTICQTCHKSFNKAKMMLTFTNENIPPHFRGHSFKLEKEEKMNWKVIKSEMGKLRKNLKSNHGILISSIQMKILIRWLTIPYEEWDD